MRPSLFAMSRKRQVEVVSPEDLDKIAEILKDSLEGLSDEARQSLTVGLNVLKVLESAQRTGAGQPEVSAELQSFLEREGQRLAHMLMLYRKLLRPDSFFPRVMGYRHEPQARRWEIELVHSGEPSLLQGSAPILDAMMDTMMSEAELSLAIWLRAIPIASRPMFLAYVRQIGEAPRLLLLDQGSWIVLPLNAQELGEMMAVLLEVPSRDERLWKAFLGQQARSLRTNARQALQPAFEALGMSQPPSSEQWDKFVPAVFLNAEVVRHWQAAVRDLGSGPLSEAHYLLQETTVSLERHLDMLETRQNDLEKSYEKKARRLRTDLQRTELLFAGVRTRVQKLERENQQLRVELRASTAGAKPAGSTEVTTLGKTFDALF
ncbi:hypothetical protein D3C71_25070 [compost metagenome]